MTINTLPDIIGSNASVALTAKPGTRARHLYLTALGGNARIGGATAAAAQGVAIIQNVSFSLLANEADPSDLIDLSTINAYVPSGTTLTICYA